MANYFFDNFIIQSKPHLKPLQMNKNAEHVPLRQSTKSIQKFKALPIEQRVHIVSSELLGNSKYSSKPKLSRASLAKPNAKKTQEDLVHRIKSLEAELQRKLNSDGILRNFFKTINNSDLTRIDIYLELRKCEEIIEPLQLKLQEQIQKNQKMVEMMKSLESELQEKQKKYIENIVILESQFDQNYQSRDQQLSSLRDTVTALKAELQTNRLLLLEVKNKNQSLQQENKNIHKKCQKVMREQDEAKKQLKAQMKQKILELQLRNEDLNTEIERLRSKNMQQSAALDSEEKNKASLMHKIKSLSQQLAGKIDELASMNSELSSNNRQLSHLQSISIQNKAIVVDLEQKLECAVKKYTQTITVLEIENTQIKKMNQQLREQVKNIQIEKHNYSESAKNNTVMIKDLKEKQQTLIRYYENERAEMMIELNKEKFHDMENESLRKRCQVEQAENEALILKLEHKINELASQRDSISKKLHESQRDIEKFRANEKINEKVCCEYYKTAGRLTQIKKQILLALPTQEATGQPENADESLEKITSAFAKAVYALIIQAKTSTQKMQALKKNVNQRCKQFCNLLHHFKNCIDIENIQSPIEKYLSLVQSTGEGQFENNEAMVEAYHSIIQRLINNERSKKIITETSINTANDSLDNVIFKEVRRESIERMDKKYEHSIRPSNSLHSIVKSRQSQSNKQNINTNELHRISKQKDTIAYNSVVKQGDKSSGFRKSSGRIRSQIERKYFRS